MGAPKKGRSLSELWSTPNLSVLSGASLVVGLTRYELVHPAGLPPANSPFEAEDDNSFTTDAEMVGRLGFAPSSRRLRAGTSLSKFATLMAVCKDRDTKVELNHRDLRTKSAMTAG